MSRQSFCRSAVIATCGFFATASRSASVRYAVSSLRSRSGSGLTASSPSSSDSAWPPIVMTARWTAGVAGSPPVFVSSPLSRSPSVSVLAAGFVLRPDIAAVDRQAAVGADADEDAGSVDLGGIVGPRPILESGKRGLDLAEPRIHFVGQFVGALVFGFEPGVFGLQRLDRRPFLRSKISRRAIELAQAMGVAEGEIDIRPRSTSSPRRRSSPPRP